MEAFRSVVNSLCESREEVADKDRKTITSLDTNDISQSELDANNNVSSQ